MCSPTFYLPQERLLEVIADGFFEFSSEQWRTVSGAAKDLISRMLVRADDVSSSGGEWCGSKLILPFSTFSQRLSAREVLTHPWIRDGQAPLRKIKTPQILREK